MTISITKVLILSATMMVTIAAGNSTILNLLLLHVLIKLTIEFPL